jgi:hypothetical protein
VAAVLVATRCERTPSARETAAWEGEIRRLEATQDSLRTVIAGLVAKDPRIPRLPQGEVVISVPTAFVRGVLERVFADVAGNVTLRLTGIQAHVENTVKKIVTIGKFTVDVNVREVTGKLAPGKPDVRFADDRIMLALPVQLSSGTGNATIHFVWDGKNVAGVACGDMDVVQHLTGSALPARYVIRGGLELGLRGNEIVATPRFPETRIQIRVRPSKASWAKVDSLLEAKRGVCGYVLDKVDVKQILENVVEKKGFNVALPLAKLRPFVVPAGISDSVSVAGRVVSVHTTTNTIAIAEDAILYGAAVALETLPSAGTDSLRAAP